MPGRSRDQHNCTISRMKQADIPFAVSLTDREGWGFFPSDFQLRLRLYPSGSFVARIGQEPVGIISSVEYGKHAFLGNLIVRNGYRGRGVGGKLMQHAIDYLLRKGVMSIELDGVWSAVPLYRRLGFRDKHLSLRFSRPPEKHSTGYRESRAAVSLIATLDRKLVGVARERLLRESLSDWRNSLVARGNPIAAYALIRQRAGGFSMVAPVVALHWRQVPALMAEVVTQFGDRSLWIGVPEPQHRMSRWLVSCGFEHKEPSLRMYYGKRLDYEKHVYGIFGPAVG